MRFHLTCVAAAAAAALSFAVVSTSAQATPENQFAGEWCGTFELIGDEDPAVEGTLNLSISESGVITGDFYNTTFDVPGVMRGRIRDDGMVGLNPDVYGTGPGGEGGNGEHHAGTAYIDGGKLYIPTTAVWNGGPSVLAVLELCD